MDDACRGLVVELDQEIAAIAQEDLAAQRLQQLRGVGPTRPTLTAGQFFACEKVMGSRKRSEAPGTEANASQERPTTARRGPHRGETADKEKVSAALRDLAVEPARSPKSQTARLREVLDDLEAALAAGASHAAVLATLHAQGFSFTLRSFESTLARLRKERRQQTEQPQAASNRRKRA